MLLVYVAVGGAFGSVLRYLASSWIASFAGKEFPYATLGVNLLGSLLLGLVIGLVVSMERGREIYLLLGVGALGGFTTFSTFSYETYMLVEKGRYWEALAYALISVTGGVLSFFAGMWLFKTVTA